MAAASVSAAIVDRYTRPLSTYVRIRARFWNAAFASAFRSFSIRRSSADGLQGSIKSLDTRRPWAVGNGPSIPRRAVVLPPRSGAALSARFRPPSIHSVALHASPPHRGCRSFHRPDLLRPRAASACRLFGRFDHHRLPASLPMVDHASPRAEVARSAGASGPRSGCAITGTPSQDPSMR